MTCKDCTHYDVCQYHIDEETKMTVNECGNFKDKSKFIELPKLDSNLMFDDNDLLIQTERQFHNVIENYGADGIVWFNKKFIVNYVCALYRRLEEAQQKLKELRGEYE